MGGLLALVGSGEYLTGMEAVDRHLLQATGAGRPRVVCVPAAAGAEGHESVSRWARMGLEHFGRLGAEVEAARIMDRSSADDPGWADSLARADLIYFSGGDPLYLYRALAGSRAWRAVEAALGRGAVYAGCSAGAMVMGARVPDIQSDDLELHPAFNRLPGCLILPHFDRLEEFRPGTTETLRRRLRAGEYGLGIDENTALVGRPGEEWEVMGAGGVTFLTAGDTRVYSSGERLVLP